VSLPLAADCDRCGSVCGPCQLTSRPAWPAAPRQRVAWRATLTQGRSAARSSLRSTVTGKTTRPIFRA
jgi:hypothetical protein